MDKLKVITFTALCFFMTATVSGAAVLIEDIGTGSGASLNPFNSDITTMASGEAGNYVLLVCSTTADGPNSFLEPSPGDWTLLHEGVCPTGICIQGIWGRFVDAPDGVDTTCSWTQGRFAFSGGTIRYSGVDPENPIINIACSTGTSDPAVAPSIFTEAGSQVARFVTSSLVEDNNDQVDIEQSEFTGFGVNATGGDGINVRTQARSRLFFDTGPTGVELFNITFGESHWTACTIGLRMAVTPIPTMSEWGFMAVAAFMGAAGVWYLRKRQARAS